MATPAPRRATLGQKRSAARHRAIAEATLALIEQGGHDAVTHRSVAKAAGVPTTATTYYFASKDDMVRAAIELLVERETARLTELSKSISGDPNLTLADAAEALVEIQATELRQGRLAQLTQLEFVLREARLGRAHEGEPWTQSYLDVARTVLARTGSSDPDTDAHLLVAAICGLMLEGVTVAEDDFVDRVLRPVVDRLLRLLTPAEPGADH